MLISYKLILTDEPTGSLDAKNRSVVMEALDKLNAMVKTVVIVTTDDVIANH